MAATMALLLLLLAGLAAAADPTTMTLRVVPDSIASPLGARCLDGAIATQRCSLLTPPLFGGGKNSASGKGLMAHIHGTQRCASRLEGSTSRPSCESAHSQFDV